MRCCYIYVIIIVGYLFYAPSSTCIDIYMQAQFVYLRNVDTARTINYHAKLMGIVKVGSHGCF